MWANDWTFYNRFNDDERCSKQFFFSCFFVLFFGTQVLYIIPHMQLEVYTDYISFVFSIFWGFVGLMEQ